MPMVSVIIPTFNRATVLDRSIRSVLNQTFSDFELIVVDDGSTDGTAEALDAFAGRLSVISQSNLGVSSARNLGAKNSCGELTAFLDSDDEWAPDKLERQVALYKDSPENFACHTDEVWLRNGAEVPQKEIHRKQGGRFFDRALERCLISPSSVMLSRRLLDRVGWFDEDLPAAEDYDLWLRITAFYQVEFVTEPLVIKYGDALNQLSRTTPAIDRFRIRAILKILSMPELRADYREAAERELARKCRVVASGCLKKGKTQEAEIYLELAGSYETCFSGSP